MGKAANTLKLLTIGTSLVINKEFEARQKSLK